jgi:hypothetical protein
MPMIALCVEPYDARTPLFSPFSPLESKQKREPTFLLVAYFIRPAKSVQFDLFQSNYLKFD